MSSDISETELRQFKEQIERRSLNSDWNLGRTLRTFSLGFLMFSGKIGETNASPFSQENNSTLDKQMQQMWESFEVIKDTSLKELIANLKNSDTKPLEKIASIEAICYQCIEKTDLRVEEKAEACAVGSAYLNAQAPFMQDLGDTVVTHAKQRAIFFLEKAVELQPNNPLYISKLALTLYDQGEEDAKQRATSFLEKAVELQPNNPLYISRLALALYDQGKEEEAYGQLIKASLTGNHDVLAIFSFLHGRGNRAPMRATTLLITNADKLKEALDPNSSKHFKRDDIEHGIKLAKKWTEKRLQQFQSSGSQNKIRAEL